MKIVAMRKTAKKNLPDKKARMPIKFAQNNKRLTSFEIQK